MTQKGIFRNTIGALTLSMGIIAETAAYADEGMWLPSLISQRIGDMQSKGFRLSAEDIYSVNQASLKDRSCFSGADARVKSFQRKDCFLPTITADTARSRSTAASNTTTCGTDSGQ